MKCTLTFNRTVDGYITFFKRDFPTIKKALEWAAYDLVHNLQEEMYIWNGGKMIRNTEQIMEYANKKYKKEKP